MIRTILFDLDGTILDTNELIIQSFQYALRGRSAVPVTRQAIIDQMGGPLTKQLQLFSGKEDVTDVLAAYREFNMENHDRMVKAFPYVKETIAELHAMGIKLGVVTSKIIRTSGLGLKLCGLDMYMDAVVTIEDVEKPKPDPEGIMLALRKLGGEPRTTLMVGDSQYDIEAGRNAGTRTVGVAWSLKGKELLDSCKPDYIIDDMRELIPLAGMGSMVESNREA